MRESPATVTGLLRIVHLRSGTRNCVRHLYGGPEPRPWPPYHAGGFGPKILTWVCLFLLRCWSMSSIARAIGCIGRPHPNPSGTKLSAEHTRLGVHEPRVSGRLARQFKPTKS